MQSTLPATAPLDSMMPQGAQLWMNVINWGIAAVVLVYALYYWRRNGTSVGIWLLLGGGLVTLNEPIVDVMGKVWFPAIGNWLFVKVWGVSIPTYLVAVYVWFVGGQAFLAYALYVRGITRRGIFALFVAYGVVDILIEVPSLNAFDMPMYFYYGNAPLVFMKFPLWWCFCNALMPMLIAAVVYRFEWALQGVRRPLVALLCLPLAAAANALTVSPVWIAMNIDGSTMELTTAAAFVSLGLSLMLCYALGVAVATDRPALPQPRSAGNDFAMNGGGQGQ